MSDSLTKAKTDLILDHPFIAALLLGMEIYPSKEVKTIETNGESIRFNPEYIDAKTQQEKVFILAHEVMHCVFQHMYTRGERNANRWGIAGDYLINDLLKREKIGVMPEEALYDPALVARGGETTVGIYELLDESLDENAPGTAGGSHDSLKDGGKDSAEISQKESEMKIKIAQAASAARMQGKLSKGLSRLVEEATASKTDWRTVLRNFMTEKSKNELSYVKPKRRWLAEDINLPSFTGEAMGGIVFAVDCSGSIDEKILNDLAAEVRHICEDVKPSRVDVLYFDTEITKHDSFGPDDFISVKAKGGGGTSFSPIFYYIAEKNIQPTACIVLTDLQCDDFGDAPTFPVLWAATEKGSAPFGEIVNIK